MDPECETLGMLPVYLTLLCVQIFARFFQYSGGTEPRAKLTSVNFLTSPIRPTDAKIC